METFRKYKGIFITQKSVRHRDGEYDSNHFDETVRIQNGHFWFRGRNEFLLNVLRSKTSGIPWKTPSLHAVDLGGGCGGWLAYLHGREPDLFAELALGDSSIRALIFSKSFVGNFAKRYQVDLLDLDWKDKWDVIFLLDVIEHIPEDVQALRQIRKSLKPGGLLFVTSPALQIFWSPNDERIRHQRRYSRRDFQKLSQTTRMDLLDSRYFMFFLSPLYFLSRLLMRISNQQIDGRKIHRTEKFPGKGINTVFGAILALEAKLAPRIRFPWGTSVVGIFRKPPLIFPAVSLPLKEEVPRVFQDKTGLQ